MFSYFKLTIWAILWLLIWCVITIVRKKRHNCLTWAQHKQDTEGGYLVIRWCRINKVKWIKWPHFLWLDDEHSDKLSHYVPNKNQHTSKIFPDPWFSGHIEKGDNHKEN